MCFCCIIVPSSIYSLRHAAGHQLEPALAGSLMMLINSVPQFYFRSKMFQGRDKITSSRLKQLYNPARLFDSTRFFLFSPWPSLKQPGQGRLSKHPRGETNRRLKPTVD